MHWGAKCDGHTDDAAAIQGANDYAYEHGALEVNFPATGACCSYTPPLYMDAPGNLRANLQTPTIFGFSLRWVGAGLAGNVNHGSWLCPNSEAAPALWVGTGDVIGCWHGETAIWYGKFWSGKLMDDGERSDEFGCS